MPKQIEATTTLSQYRYQRYWFLHEIRHERAKHRVHGEARKSSKRREMQRELCKLRVQTRTA